MFTKADKYTLHIETQISGKYNTFEGLSICGKSHFIKRRLLREKIILVVDVIEWWKSKQESS